MRTNASITVYNKYVDIYSRSEKFQRTQIKDVAWESRKAANVISMGGHMEVDQAQIFIPFARKTNYLAPFAWTALSIKTAKWTLQVGDVIVKALVTDEITNIFSMSDLKAKYDDVLTISSVDTMDRGSLPMQHFQVGAR